MIRYLILASLFFAGCTQTDIIRQNNRAMLSLSPGITKQELFEAMGGVRDLRLTEYKVTTNPHKVETITAPDGTIYEYIWYITTEPPFIYDGRVTQSMLTPFAFKNGLLQGWGWTFYRDSTQRLDVTVRER